MSETLVEMMELITANADLLRKESSRPKERVVEVTVPKMLQPPIIHAPEDERDESNVGVVSLPPMYTEVTRPSIRLASSAISSRETMERAYAAAYHEALRALSQQASMSAFHHQQSIASSSRRDISPPDSPTQAPVASAQVIHSTQLDELNDPKKRLLEEREEPEKKRARSE